MKKRLLITIVCTCYGMAQASILGLDNFDYTNGSELTGLDGGIGWAAGYTWESAVASTETTIQGSALQVGTGSALSNNPNLISRRFGYYTVDTLFYSVKLTATQGYGNDFFLVWLDSGNTSTSHNTISTGFDLSGNVMARMNTDSGNTMTYGSVVQGTEYTLVVGLSKSVSGSANTYDSMRFWVNPSSGDMGTPTGTLNVDTGRKGFSWIGVRNVNNESSDVFTLDNITVGTEWIDVVPEPASIGLLGLGTGALLLLRRIHRS